MTALSPAFVQERFAAYEAEAEQRLPEQPSLAPQLEGFRLRLERYTVMHERYTAKIEKLNPDHVEEAEDLLDEAEGWAYEYRYGTQITSGLGHHIKTAHAYYRAMSLRFYIARNKPIKEDGASKEQKMVRHVARSGKFVAGLVTGLSIDKMFNVDGTPLLMAASVFLGIAFNVTVLTTIEHLARKHYHEQERRHLLLIVGLGVVALMTEAALNWQGLIAGIQFLNAQKALSGNLDAFTTPAADPPLPWALMLFTLSFIGLFIVNAVLRGRDLGFFEDQQERLEKKAVELSEQEEHQRAAHTIERPLHRATMRQEFKPRERLSLSRREREKRLSELENTLEQASHNLEKALTALVAEMNKVPQARSVFGYKKAS